MTFEIPNNAGVVWVPLRGLDEQFCVAGKTSTDAEIKVVPRSSSLRYVS